MSQNGIPLQHLQINPLIYLIRCSTSNFYKIGSTKRTAEERLKELQTGSPHSLSLITTTRFYTERQLHQIFNQYRRNGEWFEFDDEVLKNHVLPYFSKPVGLGFNLWQWVKSRYDLYGIQDIKITKLAPLVEGSILFGGPEWLPISEEEDLQGWVYPAVDNSFLIVDIKFLSQQTHPIAGWAREVLSKIEIDKEEDLISTLEIWKIENADELNKILDDTTHKYHDAMRQMMNSRTENYKTWIIDNKEKEEFIKFLIPDILNSTFEPSFKLQYGSVLYFGNNRRYIIFENLNGIVVRPLLITDYRWSVSLRVLKYEKFLSRNDDLIEVTNVMNRWIPNSVERSLFRENVRKIILNQPWGQSLSFINAPNFYSPQGPNFYSPQELLRWIHGTMYGTIYPRYRHVKTKEDVKMCDDPFGLYEGKGEYIRLIKNGYRVALIDHGGTKINNSANINTDNNVLLEISEEYLGQMNWFESFESGHLFATILWALGDNITITE